MCDEFMGLGIQHQWLITNRKRDNQALMNKPDTNHSLTKRINILMKHLDPAANFQETQRTGKLY